MEEKRFIPKSFYIALLLIGIAVAFADHLVSPSLGDGSVGSPASASGACAPCGAPCVD